MVWAGQFAGSLGSNSVPAEPNQGMKRYVFFPFSFCTFLLSLPYSSCSRRVDRSSTHRWGAHHPGLWRMLRKFPQAPPPWHSRRALLQESHTCTRELVSNFAFHQAPESPYGPQFPHTVLPFFLCIMSPLYEGSGTSPGRTFGVRLSALWPLRRDTICIQGNLTQGRIFVFLFLTDFTLGDSLEVHPRL